MKEVNFVLKITNIFENEDILIIQNIGNLINTNKRLYVYN